MTRDPAATTVWHLASEADTERLGQELARLLPERCVVALIGTLGAGKTRLVQALAAAWGIDRRDVVSPTFVLLQEHHGKRTLYHLDAYRIRDDDEFWNLGMDEYFDQAAVVCIEWAERVAHCLPRERLQVELAVHQGTARRATIGSIGSELAPVVAALAAGGGGASSHGARGKAAAEAGTLAAGAADEPAAPTQGPATPPAES